MSIQMSSEVWEDESVTDRMELLVLLALANCHNPKYGCFPDLMTIAKKVRMTKMGVTRIIDRLVEKRIIAKKKGGGRGRPSSYQFCYETVTLGYPLEQAETVTLDTQTVTLGEETVTLVHTNCNPGLPFPIGENGNSEAPNPKGTVTNGKEEDSPFEKATKKEAGNATDKATQKTQSHSKPQDLAEIVEYCKSIQASQRDAEWFDAHWQGNGFTVSGKPMKDWKAVIRSWKIAGHLPSQKKHTNSAGTFKPKQKGFCDL